MLQPVSKIHLLVTAFFILTEEKNNYPKKNKLLHLKFVFTKTGCFLLIILGSSF